MEEEIILNEDEMVGFIIRRAFEEEDVSLDYESVLLVLSKQLDFMKEKGLVERK